MRTCSLHAQTWLARRIWFPVHGVHVGAAHIKGDSHGTSRTSLRASLLVRACARSPERCPAQQHSAGVRVFRVVETSPLPALQVFLSPHVCCRLDGRTRAAQPFK